jgi:hypothetical protein
MPFGAHEHAPKAIVEKIKSCMLLDQFKTL